ncbi:MAG: hypothetical protein V3U62_05080 [Sedimenticolaceae bacterium]
MTLLLRPVLFDAYRKLKPHWDNETENRVEHDCNLLTFTQLTTIDSPRIT